MKRLLVALAVLAGPVVICSGAGELKIAILAPLSGPAPTFGASTREGALLAIGQWNARGGVLGMKIRAVVEDSQCAEGPVVEAANKVIRQDRVHYIIGEVCSRASIPLSQIANNEKVIQISPTSTEPAVTVDPGGKTKAYVFRACFIDPFQGILGASFSVRTLKARRAFIICDPSNSYSRGLAEYFDISFKTQGGRIVGRETYATTDVDFSAILSKVKDARPDVVYLPDSYGMVNLITRQAKQKGIRTPFLGGDGWDSSDLDTQAADGGFFTTHYSPEDPRPEVQSFLEAYGAAFKGGDGRPKVPDALAVLAYDAVNLLLQAIKDAGADDTDKVRAALEKTKFDAVSGRISFDAQHNPEKPAAVLAVKSGKVAFFALVTP